MPEVYFLTNALPSADYCVFIATDVCKIITMLGSIDALSVIEWCHLKTFFVSDLSYFHHRLSCFCGTDRPYYIMSSQVK